MEDKVIMKSLVENNDRANDGLKTFRMILDSLSDLDAGKLLGEMRRALAEPSDELSNCNIHSAINWVAITEKLPIVGEWVLCGHNKDKWVDRGAMDAKGNFSNDECGIYPTHWAELPEPPCL